MITSKDLYKLLSNIILQKDSLDTEANLDAIRFLLSYERMWVRDIANDTLLQYSSADYILRLTDFGIQTYVEKFVGKKVYC